MAPRSISSCGGDGWMVVFRLAFLGVRLEEGRSLVRQGGSANEKIALAFRQNRLVRRQIVSSRWRSVFASWPSVSSCGSSIFADWPSASSCGSSIFADWPSAVSCGLSVSTVVLRPPAAEV